MTLLVSLALAISPLPPTPGAFWIWPDLAHAKQWVAEHKLRLCIRKVPDGWATFECEGVAQ